MTLIFLGLIYLVPIIFFAVIGCIVWNAIEKMPLQSALLALILIALVLH